jgi:MraZ protein
VDEKGRLKLPAEFKRLVDEKCGAGAKFFVTSLDGKHALLYPIREWEAKEAILARTPASNADRMLFQTKTAAYGQMAEMDNQGRLLIHPFLRNKANLGGEVMVLGMTGAVEPGFLQVTNFDLAMQELDETPVTATNLMGMAALGL